MGYLPYQLVSWISSINSIHGNIEQRDQVAGDDELNTGCFNRWHFLEQQEIILCLVVSNMFVYFHPYLGKISILTHIIEKMG